MNKKMTLGIFIDGYRLCCALVSGIGTQIQIEMLENFDLEDQLLPQGSSVNDHKLFEAQEKAVVGAKKENPFELSLDFGGKSEKTGTTTETKTNIDVIMQMLKLMSPQETQIAFNLIDTFVVYKMISGLKETNPHKIKRAIWADLFVETPTETKLENIGYVKIGKDQYLAVMHDDPLLLSSILFESMRLRQARPQKVTLIDTSEFVLAHALLNNRVVKEDEYTTMILFAQSFTKIFIMRGAMIETVLPTIHEGSDSDKVCETVFSKLLFELDSGQIANLGQIVLIGDIERVQAQKFFSEKLPNNVVGEFNFDHLPLGDQSGALAGRTSPYTVAIALALKALDDRIETPYQSNLLPRRIRERQSIYRIAWHGLLLLCILFVGVVSLTFQGIKQFYQIHQLQTERVMLDSQLVDLRIIAQKVDSLRAQIKSLEKSTALMDSLHLYATKWSPVFASFSQAYAFNSPFSLVKMESTKDGRLICDVEIARQSQVAALERQIPASKVLNVKRLEDAKEKSLMLQIECRAKKVKNAGR